MDTSALLLLEQTVLPLTSKAALGKGLIITVAVLVRMTVAHPAMLDLRVMVLLPTDRLEIGIERVVVPAVLGVGEPTGLAPTKAW